MIKYLIQEADFEIAYYLVCTYITKRNVMELHKSIISNISNSKSTLDLAPRGFGKSTVGDVDYCITRILRDPNIRIMIGSKTQTQAEAFLKEVRTHFEQNEDLIRIFGDWKTSKDNVWNVRFTLISKLADPDAYGAERVSITGVQMDDLTLFDWEAQKPLETEAPFTFTCYEYLDQITPQ